MNFKSRNVLSLGCIMIAGLLVLRGNLHFGWFLFVSIIFAE